MRMKGTDGGAREWSREEESEGNIWMGEETTNRTTRSIDNAGDSITRPALDVA
jgi:hypothetical protein